MTFVAIAEQRDLKEGGVIRYRRGGLDLLVIQSEAQVYIVENTCPHDQSPLTKAVVAEGCIRCPKHRIAFTLATGKAMGGDVVADIPLLKKYEAIWQNGQIGIELGT